MTEEEFEKLRALPMYKLKALRDEASDIDEIEDIEMAMFLKRMKKL